jgi:hypothetical protein
MVLKGPAKRKMVQLFVALEMTIQRFSIEINAYFLSTSKKARGCYQHPRAL